MIVRFYVATDYIGSEEEEYFKFKKGTTEEELHQAYKEWVIAHTTQSYTKITAKNLPEDVEIIEWS